MKKYFSSVFFDFLDKKYTERYNKEKDKRQVFFLNTGKNKRDG